MQGDSGRLCKLLPGQTGLLSGGTDGIAKGSGRFWLSVAAIACFNGQNDVNRALCKCQQCQIVLFSHASTPLPTPKPRNFATANCRDQSDPTDSRNPPCPP